MSVDEGCTVGVEIVVGLSEDSGVGVNIPVPFLREIASTKGQQETGRRIRVHVGMAWPALINRFVPGKFVVRENEDPLAYVPKFPAFV